MVGVGREGVGCEPGTRVQIFLVCHVLTQNSEQSETAKFKPSLPGCYKGMFAKVNRQNIFHLAVC